MGPTLRIEPLRDLPYGLDGLRTEAAGEGFRFVEELVAEWHEGTNRFAKPGEVFLGAFRAADLIAVGGLNRDPYAECRPRRDRSATAPLRETIDPPVRRGGGPRSAIARPRRWHVPCCPAQNGNARSRQLLCQSRLSFRSRRHSLACHIIAVIVGRLGAGAAMLD